MARPQAHARADRHDDGPLYRGHRPAAVVSRRIGWLAPVLLVTLRAIRSFAVGSEWGGAGVDGGGKRAGSKRRSTAAACRSATAWASCWRRASVTLISRSMDNASFMSWGWRLPFLFSVVLVLIAMWIRSSMEE